jgi:hypothetical protein
MTYKYWLDLIGRNSDDKEIRKALANLGVHRTLKVKEDDTDVRIDIEDQGITLVFTDEAYLYQKNDRAIGESAPILSEIIMFLGDSSDTPYTGELPMGLSRQDSQAILRARFGVPFESDDDFNWERWMIEELVLTVIYEEDYEALNSVILGLPGAE